MMKKKLKKYRGLNQLSKKAIAQKIGIDVDEYKQIEKGGDIKNDIKIRIKDLLNSKPEDDPQRIKRISESFVDIASAISPIQSMLDSVNSSLNRTLSPPKLISSYSSNFASKGYLSDINYKQNTWFNHIKGIGEWGIPLKEISDNNTKAYKGLQSFFDSQSNLNSAIEMNKSLLSVLSEPSDLLKSITNTSYFQTITDTVNKHAQVYESYLGFSSELAKTLSNSAISNSHYTGLLSASNFLEKDKSPTVLDILSGNNFTLFDTSNGFEEEREILEQIDNDPELRKQADNFIEEFNQIISDDSSKEIDLNQVDSLFVKFTKWIILTFKKSEFKAGIITQNFFKVLPYVMTLSLAFFNSAAHQKTFIELKEIQSILNHQNLEEHKNTEKLLEINQKIFDRINSESSENMQATKDVNLRTRRSVKSKIKGIVTASQKVIVLDKKIKWMEIIYVDIDDQKPKTGWVYKEYFN